MIAKRSEKQSDISPKRVQLTHIGRLLADAKVNINSQFTPPNC